MVAMEKFSLFKHLIKPSRKIITRKGESVRIICHNLKGDQPIVAVIDEGNSNRILRFSKDGKYFLSGDGSENDLYFASKKRVGWINLYKSENGTYSGSQIFSSKEDAEEFSRELNGLIRSDYLATIKIEWKD